MLSPIGWVVLVCPIVERLPFSVVRAFIPRRSSWIGGHPICTCTLHWWWTTTLYLLNCCACPLTYTWSHLLHLSFRVAPSCARNTSSDTSGYSYATHKVPSLTSCSSFITPFSASHCLSSMVTRRNDWVIILQLCVISSYKWFCHRSVSSLESIVQVLSRSHEILPSSVECTQSWSCAIIW